jgi:hypothetical protein
MITPAPDNWTATHAVWLTVVESVRPEGAKE